MIEGRSGGSGRGTRRELRAPPDSGSAQPADRTLYRVPTLDPRAAHSFPSLRRFLTLAPACWLRGKIPPHPSARSARHSSPQDGGPKGKMTYAREPVYSPKIIQRNATGSERTRRSVPSIHFLDIDL